MSSFDNFKEAKMTPTTLAQKALLRLPRPYTEAVSRDVFCEIKRTPHLLAEYDALVDQNDQCGKYGKQVVNVAIAKAVKSTLGASNTCRVDASECSLVVGDTVQGFGNINQNWDYRRGRLT